MNQYRDIIYRLHRASRKTASIIVERDGVLSVRVPERFGHPDVEKLLESRLAWIYSSLDEWRELNASKTDRKFVAGEGFLYLGRSYRLKWVSDALAPALALRDGYFQIHESMRDNAFDNCQRLFKEFYRNKGHERLPERVAHYESRMGLKSKAVRVMELGYRWASCSGDGTINFHWKCMMAPLTIIDYIVVHELAHLRHPKHNAAFWQEVDKVLPDYLERREWLRTNGAEFGLGDDEATEAHHANLMVTQGASPANAELRYQGGRIPEGQS